MSGTARGIYGYVIDSELPLERLRPGRMPRGRIVIRRGADLLGEPADILHVVEAEDGRFAFATARTGDELLSWCATTGAYRVEAERGRIWAEAEADASAAACEDRLLNALIPMLLIERGELMLHAAAVMTEVGAVIVCGPSGRGKSSLVAALGEQGYPVLAEDAVAVSSEAGRWRVWPGPTGVRLDTRTATVLGADISDAQLIRGKQVHLPRLRFDHAAAADVTAVVRLEPREGASLAVEEIDGVDAMAALFPSVFRIDLEAVPGAFRRAGELVRQVRCFSARLPDDLSRLSQISGELLGRVGAARPGLRAA